MIFNNQIAPGRNAAIRAGWNDAAWGRPHREVEAARAPWYERGYAGGLVFREPLQPAPSVGPDRTDTSITDPYAGRRATSMNLSGAIYLIVGLIEALLAIRFVLKALGANPDGGFAQLIYSLTAPLVAPFVGLFGTPQPSSGAMLEVHTLIALVIYALVAWLLVRGAWLVFGEGRSASVARTDTVQTRARCP